MLKTLCANYAHFVVLHVHLQAKPSMKKIKMRKLNMQKSHVFIQTEIYTICGPGRQTQKTY